MAAKDVLQSFVKEADISTPWDTGEFWSFVNQVNEYLKSVYGDVEAKKFTDLYTRDQSYQEIIGKMRGYLLALQTKDESITSPMAIQKSVSFDKKNSNSIFLVHGHDDGTKETAARFIEKLGLKAIILHEQSNSSKTIIEKFENIAQTASYAVVMLTPDDVGSAKSQKEQKPRARQNVILELGFFIGKLGREHVCALVKGDIELPSDINGVLHVPIDAEGMWKLKLAKEMKSAGLEVDLNQVV